MGKLQSEHGAETRHPWLTYGQILDRDVKPAPTFLREGRVPQLGDAPISVERYFDPAFFRKEAQFLWSRIWQMACREEDIPNVGDYQVYEILDKSLIIMRSSPNEVRAFYNSCLHRARKLVTLPGNKAEIKCPFHGISWNCNGTLKNNPIAWDFPYLNDSDLALPEAKVDFWGGFVFVNFDPSAVPLLDQIGPLVVQFEDYDFPTKYRAVWVQKKVRANWKVTAEAFMESHHTFVTHPQIAPGVGDGNSQYDAPNDWVTRHFSASAVTSPFIEPLSEQQILDHMLKNSGRKRVLHGDDTKPVLPADVSARAFLAEHARKDLTALTGRNYEQASDAQMLDSLLYNVFPHTSFWAGYASNIVYRWRPNGLDPETSIMDVMVLAPCAKDTPRPAPAPVHLLDLDEPWSNAPQLAGLALIFEQDMGNLPYIQEGLHASGSGVVHFGRYSEMRIRHLHQMIDRYIEEGEAGRPSPR